MSKFQEIMATTGRVGVAIKGKKVFYDWINRVDPEGITVVDEPGNFYLLPHKLEMEEDIKKYLKKNFKFFFECELFDWYTDESLWPKRLTYKMFNEWFNIIICDVIHDTTLEYEAYDSNYGLDDI
ncbi:hypothetical protein ACFLSQ_09745 [Bacteroidota bacterium]